MRQSMHRPAKHLNGLPRSLTVARNDGKVDGEQKQNARRRDKKKSPFF